MAKENSQKHTIHMACSDMDSYVKGSRMAKFYFKDYFGDGEGPHATKLGANTLQEIAASASAKLDAVKQELESGKVNEDLAVIPDRTLLKRQAALHRARLMLSNKKAKLEEGLSFLKDEDDEDRQPEDKMAKPVLPDGVKSEGD